MTLFEINEKIEKCFRLDEENAVDTETGEVFDGKYLDELEMQREEKITNIGRWIKNFDSDKAYWTICDIEQLKAQKDAFAKRQKAAENKRDSLKAYLSQCLNGQKFEAEDKSVTITFRKSEAVSIIDESSIPKKWFIKQDPKLDKAGIKAELKLGKKVKGAEIVVNSNIQVK